MFQRTSTSYAPWTVIPANNKKYARISALKRIVKCLKRGVDLTPPKLNGDVVEEARKYLDVPPNLVEGLAGRTE